ncbi:MAG: type II toxin-antitoxin system VapC family toxin [Candidatus Scalindua sp.]
MKKKVYIETSVISYYTSRPSRDLVMAARQQVTREWWEEMLQQFDTYISVLVIEEAKGGDPSAAEKRLDALTEIPVLKVSDEAGNLAEILVNSRTIPEEHSEDALHIALTTVNGMDFLLTWNFTHINNAQMKSEIIKVTERHGYECPVICSPDELLGE